MTHGAEPVTRASRSSVSTDWAIGQDHHCDKPMLITGRVSMILFVMFPCICVWYMHVYMCAHIYTDTCKSVCVCMCVSVVYMCTHIYMSTYVGVCVYMHVCMCVHIYMGMCVRFSVCTRVLMYILAHICESVGRHAYMYV